MPDYKITAPDGNAYTVTAPEGATQDQVLAYAQANYQHPAVAAGQAIQHADFSDVQGGAVDAPDNSIFRKGYEASSAVLQNAIAKPALGIAQGAAHGFKSLVDAAAITTPREQGLSGLITGEDPSRSGIGGRMADFVDRKVDDFDKYITNEEANYQRAVPDTPLNLAGAAAGQVIPFVVDAPVKGLQAIGDLSAAAIPEKLALLRKVASGAGQGATIAATQPVTGSGDYASQKGMQAAGGALAGGAIPVAARAGNELLQLGQHVLSPKVIARNNLARLVGSDPATLAKLDAAGNTVPGVTPTTAQAAPSPSAVAAEKALGNTPYKSQMVERENQNNAARMAVLRNQAGDETTMQAARDARQKAVQPFIDEHLLPATPATRWTAAAKPFDEALSKPMVRDDDFRALQEAKGIIAKVKSGAVQEDDAMQAMQELADSATSKKAQSAFAEAFQQVDRNMIEPSSVLRAIALTRNTGLGARPSVRKALDDIASTIEQSRNTRGLVPADVLDSIRQNVNDFLTSPSGKRATPQEALGVAPIRDKIVKVIGQHAPGYSDYLAAYAKHSTPINTMAAARAILEPVDNRALNSAGAAPLSLNDINRGLGSIDRGRYGVSPQAQAELDALQESLKQQGISNSVRFPGSDTAYNVNAQGSLASSLLGPTLGGPTGKARAAAALIGAGIGEHFGGPGGAAAGAGIGAFINKAANVVNKRIMDEYAKGMLEPKQAATMIRAYLKANQSRAPALLKQYPQWKLLMSENAATLPGKQNP